MGWALSAGRYLFRDARWRRALWIGLAVLLVLFGLLVWGVVALFSGASRHLPGLWESGRQTAEKLVGDLPAQIPGRQAVEELARGLPAQIPGLPAAKTPQRDVGGEDIGPVPRMAGMVRVMYAREGERVRVGYAGAADYHAVLEHYGKGYAERGFTRTVISAGTEAETHRYTGAGAAFDVRIQRSAGGVVQVNIETGRG